MADAWGGAFGTAWGASWGETAPTPTPTPTQGYAGGYLSKDHLKEWQRLKRKRPLELQPEKAEARAVRKVAKAAKLPRNDAQEVVSYAINLLSSDPTFITASLVAFSPSVEVTAEDIRRMRAWWAAVVEYAVEVADEEEILALIL